MKWFVLEKKYEVNIIVPLLDRISVIFIFTAVKRTVCEVNYVSYLLLFRNRDGADRKATDVNYKEEYQEAI